MTYSYLKREVRVYVCGLYVLSCTNPCRQFAPATKLCTLAFDICGFSLWYLHYVTLLSPEFKKNCASVCRVCSYRCAQILGDRSPRKLHVVRWRLNICGSSLYDLLDVNFLASRIFGLFLGFRKFSTSVFMYIQGVPGGKDLTSGECSLGQTIPI